MRFWLFVSFMFLTFLPFRGGYVLASEDPSEKVFPLPIEIEGSVASSHIFLECPIRQYNQPASVALKGAPDASAEGTLRRALDSIAANDAQKYLKLTNIEKSLLSRICG